MAEALYGDKLYCREAALSGAFQGRVSFEGNTALTLTGDFGADWTPLLSHTCNRVIEKGKALEVWPEFEVTEGGVQLGLNIKLYAAGYTDYLLDQVIRRADLTEPLVIRATERAYLSVNLEAYGRGSVRLGAIHLRHAGFLSGGMPPCGKRFSDRARQEFFTRFEPMDARPPLNVYFSGYRTAEGFEGVHLMRALGAPFLIVSDPRIEGGAFYAGSEAYEKMLADEIRKTYASLHFTSSDLIFSGLSMGTYGALRYAAALHPHAVIAGKPLLNGGSIAKNAAKARPDDFATSLDVLRLMTGACDGEAVKRFDLRLWETLGQGDFSDTTVAVAYMREDDYDRTAYEDLVSFLAQKGVCVYGKGITGRHNDNSRAVNEWFVSQLKRVMTEDFGRVFAE